jgi:RNA polymerase-binding transcription factor
MTSERREELRQVLEERRRTVVAALKDGMKVVRAEHGSHARAEVVDDVEASEAEAQGDLELAIVEIRSEMLVRIDEALARLKQGVYGDCFACGEEIAERRLRALPFAVRCRDCEEEWEAATSKTRAARRRPTSLFMDIPA